MAERGAGEDFSRGLLRSAQDAWPPHGLRALPVVAAITSVALGVAVLFGWAFGLDVLPGWFVLAGARAGLYTPEIAVALTVACGISASVFLILRSARSRHLVEVSMHRMQATEAELRAVTDAATDAIVSADAAGAITYFSKGAERLFGLTAAEAVGAPLTVLMPERFHDPHRRGLRRFVMTGEGYFVGNRVELVARRHDGAEFPVELSLGAWRSEEGTRLTAIVRDITERKHS